MKRSSCLLSVAALSLVASTAWSARGEARWRLVWSDEFEGPALDYGKWGVAYNALGGGNQELQFYTDRRDNVRIEDGALVLEAHADGYAGLGVQRGYSSGSVRTKRRGDWRYGRVEVRARMPRGQGLWPAIWMLPTDEAYGGWAASGELDVMEYRGHEPDKVHGTLHFGGAWPDNRSRGAAYELDEGTFADDFHVFAVEWERGVVRWFVDGERYQVQDEWQSDGGAFPAPFDQPFHLILNLAVGGRWAGPPDDETAFPQRMSVDWVRVYQRR
ncbi:MAG: glycoside hydrolase family 16 protein [Planctomycetota bacterium]